jgi:hypothetical protein
MREVVVEYEKRVLEIPYIPKSSYVSKMLKSDHL